MALAHGPHPANQRDRAPRARIDLFNLGMLFVAIVAIAVGMIGIVLRGSTPFGLLPAVALGVMAIVNLRK